MEVATATEPERSEGKRCKFYEVLPQTDQRTILKLGEATGLARHKKDFEAARIAGNFVTAQRTGKILLCLEAGGEDDGVFDGEARALAEVGADGVSGIAEDGDATYGPGESGEPVLNLGVDGVFGVGNEIGNG